MLVLAEHRKKGIGKSVDQIRIKINNLNRILKKLANTIFA